jgi:hypothetical protein
LLNVQDLANHDQINSLWVCMWKRGGIEGKGIESGGQETNFMYLRAIFCTFQISVDFYFEPVRGRGGAGEGEGARERGIECILYGYT